MFETRFMGAVIVGCKESFGLTVASRDDVGAATDDGALAGKKINGNVLKDLCILVF